MGSQRRKTDDEKGLAKGKPSSPEFWLRGPLPGVPPLLQPVAHALLQAREEGVTLTEGFPDEKLWERPANAASPGFHPQNISGVVDRIFTYARGESLSAEQLRNLESEGTPRGPQTTSAELSQNFHLQVEAAIEQLSPHRGPYADTGTQGRASGQAIDYPRPSSCMPPNTSSATSVSCSLL